MIDTLTPLMVLGFLFSVYSVIGNDSIQTLGTFMTSNQKIKWQYLWVFAALILVGVISWSWVMNNGDISHGRLTQIPFVEVRWYHACAPLVLVFLTRFGIPVSTSLLVLSTFTASVVFEKILLKSILGYGIAALSAYIIWILIFRWDKKTREIPEEKRKRWIFFQWFATGFLWYSWLVHDIANIAIFLPRQLSFGTLLFVLLSFVLALAYFFRLGGGKIQEIVQSKTNTSYIRSATMINLVYAFILLYFKEINNLPMSTTWVFVGMLTGRELAIATFTQSYQFKTVFPLVGKDLLRLLLGLFISVMVALGIQHIDEIAQYFQF